MGVINAHGADINQINRYNKISSIKYFSIAEYYYEEDKEPIEPFIHSHSEYEFMVPIKTIPLLAYDKANYIGEVGYIYPVNSMTPHGLSLSLDKSHCFSITVSKEFIDIQKELLGFKDDYFYTRYEIPAGLIETIRSFQNEMDKSEANLIKLNSIAKLIVSILIEEGLSKKIDNRRPEKKYHKNIKKIIVYMNENSSDKDLDIAKLAEMSGYSLAYFSKAFKAYMHDSPVVHLNKIRISEAKALMVEGETSLSLIADKVGYKNFSSFTEAFKRVTGLTPSEYQNKYFKK